MKRTLFIRYVVAILAGLGGLAASPAQTESAAAPESWANLSVAFNDLSDFKKFDSLTPEQQKKARVERMNVVSARMTRLRQRVEDFYLQHPSAPERWDAVVKLQSFTRHIVILPPQTVVADDEDYPTDVDAERAFLDRIRPYTVALEQSPDVPDSMKESVRLERLLGDLEVGRIDLSAIENFARAYPENPRLAHNVVFHLSTEADVATPEIVDRWTRLTSSPHHELARLAEKKLRYLELTKTPLELTFTAIDGRPVDLKNLRGKVVLVDFWATWCPLCLIDMPSVKALYEKYHSAGLEIIGISCDFAPRAVDPSNKKAGAARTREQVLEFTRTKDMPWPHFYDGKKHNEGGNAVADLLGVTGIPATFLIDQSGRIVGTRLFGKKREAEIRRLLNL